LREHVLIVRLDNAGDVLLTGPAVRAVAARARRVTFLAGPTGAAAAGLLPGVDEVITWDAPWVGFDPPPVSTESTLWLIEALRAREVDCALVLVSFHQSPLPTALLLRLAGVTRIAATGVDYPGSLLDERLPYVEAFHEVEQNMSVAAALGYPPPAGDDGCLAVRPFPPIALEAELPDRYVVVHPAASVPARSLPPALAVDLLGALVERGTQVVVTGSAGDRDSGSVPTAGRLGVVDLTGRTDLAALGRVLEGARAVVTGNTGPAHLAAAVRTPVVCLFAPVVAPHRWAPWGVPHRLLGRLDIDCAGCRARSCPRLDQPCTAGVSPRDVVEALDELDSTRWLVR
jgi:ADP-heptose:LPS heptosyltransferase